MNILLTIISYDPFWRVEAHDANTMESIQAQLDKGFGYGPGFLKILLVGPVSAAMPLN